MRAEEEAHFIEEARQKVEEHKRSRLKVEEGVRLDLEARRRADKEYHACLEDEEEARIV